MELLTVLPSEEVDFADDALGLAYPEPDPVGLAYPEDDLELFGFEYPEEDFDDEEDFEDDPKIPPPLLEPQTDLLGLEDRK